MKEPQRDLIAEAREVLRNASRIHALNDRDPGRDEDVTWLLDSLCSALEEQQELNRVQAESIRSFQAQEKLYRAAIITAEDFIEAARRDALYIYTPAVAKTILRSADRALSELRAALYSR